MRRTILAVLGVASVACSPSGEPEQRRRRTADTAQVDRSVPMDVRQAFTPPASWETVENPAGLSFRQPPGFTMGLNAFPIVPCTDSTPQADVPIFERTFMERWPLTLAVRRGDVNRIAHTNGFTLDSTVVATHESGSGQTTVRRGEGWVLLSGSTDAGVSVTFAAVRIAGGCNLILAARGADLHPDTLGMVLTTVRFRQ